MNKKIIRCLGFFLLIFAMTSVVMAEGGEKTKLNKPDGSPYRTHFTINNLSTWIWANGDSDIDPGGNSGLVYPKGSGRAAVFETGFVWGGKVDGEIRVGGSAYRQGLEVGRVITNADGSISPQNPEDEDARIYRVRPDWETGDVTAEMNLSAETEAEVRAQYQLDWNQWPAEYGAPYEDVDGNDSYDPTVDIPGVPGAHQTIWYVANDLDESNTIYMYGSQPLGLEQQFTCWGYNVTGPLQNMLFRKYTLINKSQDDFEDMYVSLWSDIDLGGAGDDYVGCDVDLSLAYSFNGTSSDPIYGDTPPAVGFDYFQGPLLDRNDPTDQGIFNGEIVQGKYNMPMTSFYFFINSDPIYSDPTQGDYTGSIEFYNLFRGLISTTGQPFTDPHGNETVYPLSGDPIAGTGWIDGQLHPPGDRRCGSVSGPFTMEAGQVQEIVVAEIVAGDMPNVDNKSALGLLKFYDAQAQFTYDNFFKIAEPPAAPKVEVQELDRKIILNWGQLMNDEGTMYQWEETEAHNELGYLFEGYNVYQLPNEFALSKDQAVLVGQFDIVNSVGKIKDDAFDIKDGVVNNVVAQFGTDNGISRTIEITNDAVNNSPLYNGSEYYFAVTSYGYNASASPKQVENPIAILKATPHSADPGVTMDTERGATVDVVHTGSANATVDVTVVDPTKTTGHEYQVYFNEQLKYLGLDGYWYATDAQNISLGKDLNGSFIDFAATADYQNPTQFIVTGHVTIASDVHSWADGVEITFPAGTEIVSGSVDELHGGPGDATPVIDGNKITWGSEALSGWGPFAGTEVLTIFVKKPVAFPLTVDYTIYDDGYGGDIQNFVAQATMDVIAPEYRVESHWNLKDVTLNQDVLEDQIVVSGAELYPVRRDLTLGVDQDFGYGANYGPEVDGFKIQFTGGYAAPAGFLSYSVRRGDGFVDGRENVSFTNAVNNLIAGHLDYAISSYGDIGWAASNMSVDAYGNGTTSIDILQSDLEFRFTGEYEGDPSSGVVYIKEGTGSIATIYGARGYSIADHPMNPNPGTDAPFTVRIPFEVWDVERDMQINIVIYDRIQSPTNDPFFAFNPHDRMYTEILTTPYNENVNDPADDAIGQHLSWNHVWWDLGNWETGDVIEMVYANPIQKGVDVFNFTTPAPPAYSADNAKEEVEEINVFPNPYYGINPLETDKYQRIVTFNHLPEKADFRIFNLAGQSVAYFQKDEPGQHFTWDLTNHHGLPVASGIYIVYIDLPDLGETKILKLAIIQEKQLLDRY